MRDRGDIVFSVSEPSQRDLTLWKGNGSEVLVCRCCEPSTSATRRLSSISASSLLMLGKTIVLHISRTTKHGELVVLRGR